MVFLMCQFFNEAVTPAVAFRKERARLPGTRRTASTKFPTSGFYRNRPGQATGSRERMPTAAEGMNFVFLIH